MSDLRLILIDARGHGRSEPPVDRLGYAPAADAADVVACLDDLGLPAAAVCGWSWGAITALVVAALHPQRITAVAALGLPAGSLPFSDTPYTDREADEAWARDFERDGMRPVVDALTSEERPGWARMIGAADPLEMAARLRGSAAAGSLPHRLRDIRQPLLVVWAEDEVPGLPLPLPDRTRVVVLPGIDHVGVMEHPDLVLPDLRGLLALSIEGGAIE